MRLKTLWLIALCSLSYYLYNDRPTTGGDPSSRQRQWTRRLNWVDVWRESFPVQSTQTKVGEKSGRLPNFLLVGAQKAGTTATYSYLRKQDGVCGTFTDPNGDKQKETHFFDKTREFRLGMEYYRSKFSHCDSSKLILDATPNYMLYPERVREIYEQQGTADTVKVMFILRGEFLHCPYCSVSYIEFVLCLCRACFKGNFLVGAHGALRQRGDGPIFYETDPATITQSNTNP